MRAHCAYPTYAKKRLGGTKTSSEQETCSTTERVGIRTQANLRTNPGLLGSAVQFCLILSLQRIRLNDAYATQILLEMISCCVESSMDD